MKTRFFAGLLASFAGLSAAACGEVETVPNQDPPVATPEPETNTGPKNPPIVEPVKPTKPQTCGTSLPAPQCASTEPAPDTAASITQFVKDDAIPIRCGDPTNATWDLKPLVDAYGDKKIFAVGEVHGTNEIGIVSSLVFETLASKDLVNVLGFEMPMDLEPMFQHYVETGNDAQAEQMMKYIAPNMFGSILTKTARDLVAKGHPIKVAAVDIPYTTALPVKALQEIAGKLTSQAQKDSVLSTLPTSASEPATPDDIAKVDAYFDHIQEKKTEICAELSEADCDRLDAMTHALWAATTSYQQEDPTLWFARREVAIYYNMRQHMASPSARMYLHMGAFHTNKNDASAGSRMAKEYALTKGQMFSVGPAYGDGSVIWYGEDMDLPGEPTTIIEALTSKPQHPFFVSTMRPSAKCVTNPLGEEIDGTVASGTRGQLYDGYIHYGQLTSEKKPTSATLTRPESTDTTGGSGDESTSATLAAKLTAFRTRVAAREAQLKSVTRSGKSVSLSPSASRAFVR